MAKKITTDDYLKGRDKKFPLSAVQKKNMEKLLEIINKAFAPYDGELFVTSGYRDPETNRNTPGAAPKSSHLMCEAIDLCDPAGVIKKWVIANNILETYDLYMEDPAFTPNWCHLQTRKVASGRRIFKIK